MRSVRVRINRFIRECVVVWSFPCVREVHLPVGLIHRGFCTRIALLKSLEESAHIVIGGQPWIERNLVLFDPCLEIRLLLRIKRGLVAGEFVRKEWLCPR